MLDLPLRYPHDVRARRRTRGRGAHFLLLAALVAAGACSDGTTDPVVVPDPDEFDHGAAPGASARSFLADDDFDRLVVQVQYVEGFQPTEEGLEYLEDFLNARLNKPGGIEIRLDGALPTEPQETYTANEVRALEEEHRTEYTEEGTLAAYLVFVDGTYAEQENVLGIAYNNTSAAIFAERIEENTGGLGSSRATIEGAVANHEFGHLLGLVDNGSEMQNEHRDEDHGEHCDDPDCLMYYAVRTTNFIEDILLGGVPELDAECLADLQANGGR